MRVRCAVSVETTGAVPARELFRRAVRVFVSKIRELKTAMEDVPGVPAGALAQIGGAGGSVGAVAVDTPAPPSSRRR